MFTLTPAGRHELHAFTTGPARPAAMRDDLLVKLHAVDAGDENAVREALVTRLAEARAKLALYDRLREGLLADRDEGEYLRDAERVGPYLTLLGGRMHEQQNIRWCTAVLQVLEQRSTAIQAAPSGGPRT